MVLILNDDHLKSLQCSKCHKYLSVFPVKNHSSRAVTCGRCSREGDDNDEGVQSPLYEMIARKFLFRCVNRYEGCKELLRTHETEAHEKVCVGKVFDCPKCQDGNTMPVLELIWHYKLRHPSSYLEKNSFEWKGQIGDTMLYVQDEVVFFILSKSLSNGLSLCAATLTGADARQAFMISQGSSCQRTKNKSCKSINAYSRNYFNITLDSVEVVRVVFDLEVSKSDKLYDISMPSTSKRATAEGLTATVPDEGRAVKLMAELENSQYKLNDPGTALLNKFGHEINLACSNCKQVIGLPVFECTSSSKHKICYNCRTWCTICNCFVISSDSNDALVKVNSHLQFACKWKCGRYFTSTLRTHERGCVLRIRKCPECTSDVHLTIMESHLLKEHQKYFCEEYDRDKVVQFICNEKNGEVYFMLNDEWCSLKWNFRSTLHYDFTFTFLGNLSGKNLTTIIDPYLNVNNRAPTAPYISFGGNSRISLSVPISEISLRKPYLKFK